MCSAWENTMNRAIEEFITSKRIAVVGISRKQGKFGNRVLKELGNRGYEVYPVHPEAEVIEGVRCHASLTALRGAVDAVVVCIRPAAVDGVLREAAAIGLNRVWLQQGAESPSAVALGAELGMNLVAGKCILMYAPPVGGFHAFHRGMNRLFGRL